jgi:type IV secretory pathway VirB2 component (pilin)
MIRFHRSSCLAFLLLFGVLGVAPHAFAASAGMPWEGPLDRLVQSLTGPVAKGIGTIALVACGLGAAFSEGHGMKKFLWAGIGLVIVVAIPFLLSFLGFAGGLAA